MNDGKRFITDIHTGTRRRQHLGNLNELAASIADAGLRNPVIITPGNQLISGYRRLKATALLGAPDIPVHVADDLAKAVDLITAENQDRTCQAPMTATEVVDYIGAIRVLRRTPRMQTVREAGNAILGYSYSRYCLIQQVVEAVRAEDDPDGVAHRGLADLGVILNGRTPPQSRRAHRVPERHRRAARRQRRTSARPHHAHRPAPVRARPGQGPRVRDRRAQRPHRGPGPGRSDRPRHRPGRRGPVDRGHQPGAARPARPHRQTQGARRCYSLT